MTRRALQGWRSRAGLCLMQPRRGGPCLHCLEQRLREAGFDPQGPLSPAPDAQLQALLAAQDPGPGWLAPVLRLSGGQAYLHALLAIPGCPSCGGAPRVRGGGPVTAAALRDPLLGIVSGLLRQTPGVDAGALCHGVSGRIHMPRAEDAVGVRGHGFTPEAAALGLLGESVERYSALRPVLAHIRMARMGELAPHECLGPALFGLSAAQRSLAGLACLDGRHRIGWVRGERLRDGAPVWVPAAAAYLSRAWRADEPRFAPQNSHGTAAHISATQATERALLELCERRAMTRAWHQQDFGRALEPQSLAAHARELDARLQAAGVQRLLCRLETAPAVVLALLWHEDAPWYLIGSAARLDAGSAAAAALLEAASGWQVLRQSPEPVLRRPRLRPIDDAASHHRMHAGPQRAHAVIQAIRRSTRPAEGAAADAASASTDLPALMAREAPDAVVVRLASPDIAAAGFHVHRVLAPRWPLFHFGRIGTPQQDLQAVGWPPAAAPHPYR